VRRYTYVPFMSKSTHHRLIAHVIFWSTLLVGVPVGILAFAWLLTIPDVQSLARQNPTSTALIDHRLTMASKQGHPPSKRWTWIPLTRISLHLQRAVIAAEDASFFSHEGFDWQGIKDAAIENLESGEMKRGGSTITQQLAKNLYLSSKRSLLRKAREALITRSLEHHLTKGRILELYLNVAEWGNGVYGAEAAARHHFGKPATELTQDEAAWLAAILPSPLRYDPLRKTAFLTRRHQRILRWLHKVPTSSQTLTE